MISNTMRVCSCITYAIHVPPVYCILNANTTISMNMIIIIVDLPLVDISSSFRPDRALSALNYRP
jgi:hypothetical protein